MCMGPLGLCVRLCCSCVQNVARCPAVAETALATISETPLQAVVEQIVEEKKIEDPELVCVCVCVAAASVPSFLSTLPPPPPPPPPSSLPSLPFFQASTLSAQGLTPVGTHSKGGRR